MLETLILARHAHAASNAGDTINGIPPGEGLSPQGVEEAVALGAHARDGADRARRQLALPALRRDPHARTRRSRHPRHRRAAARRDRLRLVRRRLARRVPRVGVAASARGRVPGWRRDARRRRAAHRRRPRGAPRPARGHDPGRHARPAASLRDRCRGRLVSRAAARASVPHAAPFRFDALRSSAPPRRWPSGRRRRGSPIPRSADDDPAAPGRCILAA